MPYKAETSALGHQPLTCVSLARSSVPESKNSVQLLFIILNRRCCFMKQSHMYEMRTHTFSVQLYMYLPQSVPISLFCFRRTFLLFTGNCSSSSYIGVYYLSCVFNHLILQLLTFSSKHTQTSSILNVKHQKTFLCSFQLPSFSLGLILEEYLFICLGFFINSRYQFSVHDNSQ